MHTMQVQPGRCRGCLVVITKEGSPESSVESPKTAALAKASSPEGSHSCPFSNNFLFLVSEKQNKQVERGKTHKIVSSYQETM